MHPITGYWEISLKTASKKSIYWHLEWWWHDVEVFILGPPKRDIHFCVRETSMTILLGSVYGTRYLFYQVVFLKDTLSWLEESCQIYSINEEQSYKGQTHSLQCSHTSWSFSGITVKLITSLLRIPCCCNFITSNNLSFQGITRNFQHIPSWKMHFKPKAFLR